jgi:hypothetical protein
MPFKSSKQRKYMYANHPKIASRWTREEMVDKRKEHIQNKSKKRMFPLKKKHYA